MPFLPEKLLFRELQEEDLLFMTADTLPIYYAAFRMFSISLTVFFVCIDKTFKSEP